jgi:hypothetical protein
VPTLPNLPPKTSTRLDDVMIIMGDVLGLPGSTFQWRRHNPPRSSSVRVPLVERPPLLRCKAPDHICPVSATLMGSQHPSSGLFNPMEVRTDHLPMCTGPTWYLSVGHDPTHQQLRPPWAHKSQGSKKCQSHLIINIVKHVHKTPITPVKSSKTLYKLAIQVLEKVTWHPIGLVSTGRGKFPEETSSEPCKWVMWIRDV